MLKQAALLFAALFGASPRTFSAVMNAPTVPVIVGYGSNSPVSVFSLNCATGALTELSTTPAGTSPGWLVIAPGGPHVYALNEAGSPGGVTVLNGATGAGGPSAYNLTNASFAPMLEPATPVHGALFLGALFTVSYGDGSFSSYIVQPDGSLLPGALARTGAGSNAHQIVITPRPPALGNGAANVLVPLLGDDSIFLGVVCNSLTGQICNSGPPARSRPGSGPRLRAE